MVRGGNHRMTRSHFGFTAGMRLRHVRRAAHLNHVFAAFAFLDRHGALRHHARQQRCGRPVEDEERKCHGSRTTHGVSVWLPRTESKCSESHMYVTCVSAKSPWIFHLNHQFVDQDKTSTDAALFRSSQFCGRKETTSGVLAITREGSGRISSQEYSNL